MKAKSEENNSYEDRVIKARQGYDKGRFVKKSKEDFLKELRIC